MKYHAFRFPEDGEDDYRAFSVSQAYLGVFDTPEDALLKTGDAYELFIVDEDTGRLELFGTYEFRQESGAPYEKFLLDGWLLVEGNVFLECRRTRRTYFGKGG